MTTTTAPVKPELQPFQECPPEVTLEECLRIQIAVRALDDLTEGRFTPGPGYYNASRCAGCILGGLAFAMVKGNNSILDGVSGQETFSWFVGKAFGILQARRMEKAYEGWGKGWMFGSYNYTPDWYSPERRSYRMRSILSNIILNKGTFDPITRVEPIA